MAHGAFLAGSVGVKMAKAANGVIEAERIADLVAIVVSAVPVVSAAAPLRAAPVVLAALGKRWIRQTWRNLRRCAKPLRP
jgi:hypothetical protein